MTELPETNHVEAFSVDELRAIAYAKGYLEAEDTPSNDQASEHLDEAASTIGKHFELLAGEHEVREAELMARLETAAKNIVRACTHDGYSHGLPGSCESCSRSARMIRQQKKNYKPDEEGEDDG